MLAAPALSPPVTHPPPGLLFAGQAEKPWQGRWAQCSPVPQLWPQEPSPLPSSPAPRPRQPSPSWCWRPCPCGGLRLCPCGGQPGPAPPAAGPEHPRPRPRSGARGAGPGRPAPLRSAPLCSALLWEAGLREAPQPAHQPARGQGQPPRGCGRRHGADPGLAMARSAGQPPEWRGGVRLAGLAGRRRAGRGRWGALHRVVAESPRSRPPNFGVLGLGLRSGRRPGHRSLVTGMGGVHCPGPRRPRVLAAHRGAAGKRGAMRLGSRRLRWSSRSLSHLTP